MNRAFQATLFTLVFAVASAAPAAQTCPDGAPADAINRAGNRTNCLLIRVVTPPQEPNPHALLVFLHGDNQGQMSFENSVARFGNTLAKGTQTKTVFAMRPGYRSELGKSDGFNAMADDDYTAGNVTVIAQALDHLRAVHGKKIILIGHSGGAAMSALVANRYPQAADAYVLVACPCNVPEVRAWRSASVGRSGHWPRSLSPHDELQNIPKNAKIALVVGTADTNTKPIFSSNHLELLQKLGINATLTLAQDATHRTVMTSPELYAVIQQTIAQMPAN